VECLKNDWLEPVCASKRYEETLSFNECKDDEPSCDYGYSGQYAWAWEMVEGRLGIKTFYEDDSVVRNAFTGTKMEVVVKDDESTCEINVNAEKCAMCSAANCTIHSVSYDCTNLENGTSFRGNCEIVNDPFFHPFGNVAGTYKSSPSSYNVVSTEGDNSCPDDVITIVFQDISTVTVELNQVWSHQIIRQKYFY